MRDLTLTYINLFRKYVRDNNLDIDYEVDSPERRAYIAACENRQKVIDDGWERTSRDQKRIKELKEDRDEIEQKLIEAEDRDTHNLGVVIKIGKQLKSAREVIKFYGDKENWRRDVQECIFHMTGNDNNGKRARKWLEENPE